MGLWVAWWELVVGLRDACSRGQTFLWMSAVLAGLCTREDMAGVTSVVRVLGLRPRCYDRLLDFLHSPALNTQKLTRLWVGIALRHFPSVLHSQGRLVLLADGIKVPKAGRKMPGVKKLFQSQSNTKPAYIFGHSCQAISLVACAGNSAFAVPLVARIHEGVVFSNLHRKPLTRKLVDTLADLGIRAPITLVADAYYACKTVGRSLVNAGSHLVSRVRINAVAYLPVKRLPSGRGRPRIYGKKVRLRMLFKNSSAWVQAQSPVYNESNVTLRYLAIDLLWKPLSRVVRFVAVNHPTRGKIILLSTDLLLPPIDVIRLYGIRFKIEVSFKQALRTLGAFAHHFWMMSMKPISGKSGDQHLHREPLEYRKSVQRKLDAYHRYIQLGLIAQGLLQYLSSSIPSAIWASFGSWLRTIRTGVPPSEKVCSTALRNELPHFLASTISALPFIKFIRDRIDTSRHEGARLIA